MRARTVLTVVAAVTLVVIVGMLLHGLRGSMTGLDSTAPERGGSRGSIEASLPFPSASAGDPLAEADEAGGGVIRGVVVDADEVPVSGALVVLSSLPVRTALSEESGEFAFEGLLPGPYTVSARAPAGVAGPLAALAAAAPPVLTLRLRPAALVAVNVVLADGLEPVEAASVELRGIETRPGTSDANGRALFASVVPGTYQAIAWAPGLAHTLAYLYVPVASAQKAVLAEVTLRLRRGAAVSGTVRDGEGRPVASALVAYLSAVDPAKSIDLRRDGVQTGADGRYRLDAVPAGTFRFVAKTADSAPSTSAAVTLDGQRPRDGVDISLAPGAVLAGQVVGSDGRPVAQARVTITGLRSTRSARGELRRVVCDTDGRFEARGLQRQEVSVFAESETATASLPRLDLAKLGEKRDLLLTLDCAGTISGLVVTPGGEPVAEASVGVVRKEQEPGAVGLGRLGLGHGGRGARASSLVRSPTPALTDAAGRFTLRGLAEGRYLLSAERAGGGPLSAGAAAGLRRSGGPTAEAVAATGDRETRLVLSAPGAVRGKVVRDDGSPVTSFMVALSGSTAATPFSAKDGRFFIGGQAPGEQDLIITGPDFETTGRKVTILADKVADIGSISVSLSRLITGVVRDSGGAAAAGATVRADRRISGSGAELLEDYLLSSFRSVRRQAVTDQAGAYSLRGEGEAKLFLIAEHERLGRSRPVEVPAGRSETRIDLTLEGFGAIEGNVISRRAAQSGVSVSVNAPGLRLAVVTGEDGNFYFDRLAPGRYNVLAEGVGRAGVVTRTVDVAPGAVAKIDFEAIGGSNVVVQAVLASGARPGVALMRFSESPFVAQTLSALEDEAIGRAQGFQGQARAPGGLAEISEVPAGQLSVCAAGTPTDVVEPAAVGDYLSRMVSRLPVGCVDLEVGSGVDKKVTLKIPDPPATLAP